MAYWLMKSEPDCYGIDDLERDGTNMWEGCRNYTVRNFMRDKMAKGDKAFFYHSSVQPAGIAGEMGIAGPGYPDPTQFDPKSEYYDPKAKKEDPRWFVVDVKFGRKYHSILQLSDLRAAPGLENMAVLQRGQRLSVMPVTEEEWTIVQKLVGS
jgi:predicted RNA-binding protein with PUA-like domain